jgi:hypothetical protein
MTEPIDAGLAQKRIQQRATYQQQQDGWGIKLTEGDAFRLTNMLSVQPTLTPDTAAALVATQTDWDDATLAQIARHDYERQEQFAPWEWAKTVTRGVGVYAESAWEAGIPTMGRTVTRIAQGENPITAYRKSNQNYLSEITRQGRLGNPIEIGNGIFPRSTPTLERPEFADDFRDAYAQTDDINAALESANAQSIEKYGTVLTTDVHDINNSTLINKTIDGKTYSSPYSVGRVMAIQVSRPDTKPFQVMSGLVDGTLRITADPLNAPLYEVTAAMVARNRIVRDLDQTVADQVRAMRAERYGIRNIENAPTEVGEGALADAISGSGRNGPEGRDVRVFMDRVEESYDRLKAAAAENPKGRYYESPQIQASDIDKFGEFADDIDPGLPNPYGEHAPDITNEEMLRIFEEQGGYRAFEDFILEHELVHADEQIELADAATLARRTELSNKLDDAHFIAQAAANEADKNMTLGKNGRPIFLDEDVARFDAARAEFETAQAEYQEFITPIVREMESHAQRVAFDRLIDPNYTLQAVELREKMYKAAGMRHRWRTWLKPQEASDFVNSGRADPILNWIQGETRFDQLRKRLPGLDFQTYRNLGRATDRAEVVNLLMPHLGVNIDKVPKLGAARVGRYGNSIKFDPTRPPAGSVEHTWSSKLSEQIRLTGRRLAAESQPITLNPYDPLGSADGAVAWLKTVRATDDDIERVLRLIERSAGQRSFGTTVKAAEEMTKIMVRRLKELGYNPADVEKVLTQMNSDQVTAALYWVDNATAPVHRWDDGYEVVIGVNKTEDTIEHLSAVSEAQFSTSYIGMPNLRDTRRATAPWRAGRESLMRWAGNAAPWEVKATRLGMDPGWILNGADKVQGVWRTAMLLRFGWPVRVVGEEMLRAHAYGYGHWFSHPIDILGQIANSEAKVNLLGDSLREIAHLDGLGTGGWRDVEQVYDMSRANWTTARYGQAGFEAGMVQELLQLRGSRLARAVARYGPAETYQMIMRNEDNLMDVVRVIGKYADKNSTLYKMSNVTPGTPPPEALRRHLESLDAMIHQQGGGEWLQRATKGGPWMDMDGNVVPSLMEKTKPELLEIAGEAQIVGRHSMTKAELADSIYQATGRPNLDKVDSAQQFLVIENGNDRVRKLVSDGTWGDEVWLTDDMNIEQINQIEAKIVDSYEAENVYGPQVVRTMTTESRNEARVSTVIDRAFEWLMAKPSKALARNPHFVTRYTEEVARMYLTAQPAERAMIEAWVEANGFGTAWRRSMGKILDQHGLARVPGEVLDADALLNGKLRYLAAGEGSEVATVPPPSGLEFLDDVPDSVYDDIALNEFFDEAAATDMPPEAYRRELTRRIASGEATEAEVLRVAEATPFDNGTFLDVMRNDGVLRYEEVAPNPALDAQIDEILGGRAVPEEGVVYHVTGAEDAQSMEHFGEGISQGGLTDDLDRARYLAREMGDDSVIQVYRTDDLPDEIRRVLDSDANGPAGNIEQGIYGKLDEEQRIAIAEELAEENNAQAIFIEADMPKPIRVDNADPLRALHDEILEGWKNGTIRQQDIDDAIGRAVARHNTDDEAVLERITELNTQLSGIAGEARGFDPVSGARGKSVEGTPDWFSNRAIGIMTDDETMLNQIDRIAKNVALEDTKALFYDLTRRKNFTDMAKFVFPFGDAFLEQMRIWTRAMTPVGEQTGQALKNWRRVQVGITNAHKSGFFSEDKYGNEVMNWPGAGLLTGVFGLPQDVSMGSTISPDQLMMMNLTPRGAGLPGTSPYIQLPAAMVQHRLDRFPAIRDAMNWFAFGDYTPASMANVGDAFAAVSPTYMRRFVSRFFGDESKEEYGQEIAQTLEALIASNDPRYGDDPERAQITVKDAQTLGDTLGLLRMFDGLFQPAQPVYNPEILIELAGKDPFWMTIAALQDEFRATRDFFGENDNAAISYFRKTFGIDPLILVGATREVQAAPVTKEAYDEHMAHVYEYDAMGPAKMLFLPSSDLDPFYLPAYQKTFRDGNRERLNADQVMVLIQKAKGYNQLESINATWEAAAVKLDGVYDGDHRNPGWSVAMDDLNRWKQQAQQDVYAMFPPVHPESKSGKTSQHPSYHDVITVVVEAGTPGTNQFAISEELQPELHEWVTQFSQAWRNVKELSMTMDTKGHSDQWWLTSTSESAEAIRHDFTLYLNKIQQETYAAHPEKRESLENQIGWFMSRAIEPLFDGYSIEDDMYLERMATPPPPDLSENSNQAATVETTS